MGALPLVTFDLGGVLLRICRSWAEGCSAARIPMRPAADDPQAIARRHDLLAAYQDGAISCEDFFARYAAAIGGGYSADEVRAVHDAWLLHEYDGVADLVDELHARGVETGVLSNTNASHWTRLCPPDGRPPDFPTAARTRHPRASHLLRLSKPGLEIYRRYEALTGRAAGEIVFFDDTPANVDAARRAGWRAHAVDPTADPARQVRDHLRRERVLP